MTPETLDALKRSISNWDANSKVENIEDVMMGILDCPLCLLFYADHCIGCPVFERTGCDCCENTPYYPAVEASDEVGDFGAPLASFHVAAAAERDFLISLLPKDEGGEV